MAAPKPLDQSEWEVVGAAPATSGPSGPLDSNDWEEVPKIGRGKAALATSLQGATLGGSDELHGVGGVIGEGLSTIINEGRLPTKAEIKSAYTDERDSERKDVVQAKHDYPKQSFLTETAGSMLVPIPGLGEAAGAVKAVGLGRKAAAAVRALAPAAATGAVAGIGYQDSGEGNIATTGQLATAGTVGAVTGAAVSAGVKGVTAGVRRIFTPKSQRLAESVAQAEQELSSAMSESNTKVADKIRERLADLNKQQGVDKEVVTSHILDQISRNPDGKQVTMTVKKHLEKAGNLIYDEAVKGADGETMQAVLNAPTAKEGLALIKPVTQSLGEQKAAAYDVFRKAGVNVIDMEGEYLPKIQAKIREATRDGDKPMADGLKGIRDMLMEQTAETQAGGGQTDMLWLRAHETNLQNAAASKIGGFNEHETARLARHVAEDAKEVLNDVFDDRARATIKQGELPYGPAMLKDALDKMHSATGDPAFKNASERLTAQSKSPKQMGLFGEERPIESPDLVKASNDIRAINKRFRGWLTVQDALEGRQVKEGVSGGAGERFGKKIGKVISMTGAGGGLGMFGGPVGAGIGAGVGAVAGSAEVVGGKLGMAYDRRMTNRAIEQLRAAATGKGPDPTSTIKTLAGQLNLPERVVRSTYIKIISGLQ